MERADEPHAQVVGPDAGLLASDVLVLMASAGLRLREVTARGEVPGDPPSAPPPPAGTGPAPAPAPAPTPLPPLARAVGGVSVAPGWGRRAPPPIR